MNAPGTDDTDLGDADECALCLAATQAAIASTRPGCSQLATRDYAMSIPRKHRPAARMLAEHAAAAEKERCAGVLRAMVTQVNSLDPIDPQPDLSCIDWLRSALSQIEAPSAKKAPT